MHLYDTVREPRHRGAFVTMMLLATGGFMLMPFGSAYLVNNLGIALTSLPMPNSEIRSTSQGQPQ